MAGNLKQRLIKAGRDFNYAEGQKVKAAEAIKADQIVYISGSEGPFSIVSIAYADTALHALGRLLIAKHDIPANGYGVCVPWKLVTSIATNGKALGDAVYLIADPSDATLPNLSTTAPVAGSSHLVLGRVTKAATVAAGAGIMVEAAAPEAREVSGVYPATGGKDAAGTLTFVVDAGADSQTIVSPPFPVIFTDCWIDPGHASQPVLTVSTTDGTLMVTAATGSNSKISRLLTMTYANCDVAASTTVTLAVANHNAANTIFLTAIRA